MLIFFFIWYSVLWKAPLQFFFLRCNWHVSRLFFWGMRTFKIYCLSNFQINSTVLLTVNCPGGSVIKNSLANTENVGRFYPWVGKIPWRRKWQPTPIFFPRKSHRQRSLVALQSMASRRVGHDWVTEHTYTLLTVVILWYTTSPRNELISEPKGCIFWPSLSCQLYFSVMCFWTWITTLIMMC